MNQLKTALVSSGIVADPTAKKARRSARAHRNNLIAAMLGATRDLETARARKKSTKPVKARIAELQAQIAAVNVEIRGGC